MNCNIVEQAICDLLDKLSRYQSVDEIRMFGSQVLEYNQKSDIDIMILYNNINDYEYIIKDLSKISYERNILIHPVMFEQNIEELEQNYFIKENILKKSKIIYQKKPHFT
jgi:predicted nucleotidyltransferase